MAKFLRATLIGGFFVLFPLFGCVYFIIYMGGLVTSTIRPILGLLFDDHFANLPYADILSFLLLILLCFLAGVFMLTPPGKGLTDRITQLLDNINLFRMFRRMGVIFFDSDNRRGAPVLVHRGNSRELGFLIEEINEDELVVFFPEVPRPFYGNAKIVKAETVERLDAQSSDLIRVIRAYGIGTKALLADTTVKRAAAAVADPAHSS